MKWAKKTGFFEQCKKYIASIFWLDPCAGGICLRERRWKIEILCVLHKNGMLMLPKWKMKQWEKSDKAALREFQEETGIRNSVLWKKIGTIRDRIRRKKIIFYSICYNHDMHTALHDEAIMWVHLHEAAKKMKHGSEKKFLEKYFTRSTSAAKEILQEWK
jgi:8-oxo-dGTP pyrophosphatase MutT (NUDIX family)